MSSVASSTRVRTPFPEGTLPVGIALLIAGFATFSFFRVGTHAVGGREQFAPLASLWFATFALAPGLFLPLEQELGRAVSHRRAIGEGARPTVQKVGRLGFLLATIAIVGVIAAGPLLARSYFDGDWFMVVALACTIAAYAPAHLARGICSGSGRFTEYAVIMGSDGVMRIILCLLLTAVGVTAVGAYGMVVAISPLFAVVWIKYRGGLSTEPGPPAEWAEVTPNLGWLLLGSLFAATLLNAGPIAASLLAAPDEQALVTEFSYGILLARIPLFLFQAVQAALLPRLSRLAARGEIVEFRDGLKRLILVVIGVGIVGTIGSMLLGHWVIERMYNANLTGRTVALLAFSSACYMMALALAQAVIALKGHSFVGIGWGIGMGSFLLALWLGGTEVFRRIEIALVASSLVCVFVFAIALALRLRSDVTPDQGSLMEAMTDMPFET